MFDSPADLHVEAAKVQKDIKGHLGLKSNALIFEYSNFEGKVKLDLITINPRHNQSFLFQSVTGFDKVDALKKMLDYVKDYKEKENSYTIQWMVKGDSELHTSYFRASNAYDALDKLYYGRDMNTITVFSVVLNPVA
ncbi:MAG: hypothetical protein AAFX87_30825 [Bacteroidota bacterium]